MSRDERSDFRAESPDEGRYSNAHRAFLQAFLSRSAMTVDEIKPVLAAVMSAKNANRPLLEGDITTPDINAIIQAINLRLTSLDYEIRSARDQRTKTLTYALVNTTSDALTQLATTFLPDEIAFIKRVLDGMFEVNNTRTREILAVTSMQASQLAKAPPTRSRQSQVNGDEDEDEDGGAASEPSKRVKSITMSDAETVLERLVEQRFFQKSRGGYYTLAPRGLMELRSYLKENYNEPADEGNDVPERIRIRDCEGCREIVTQGLRCLDRECEVRWHESCARQYFGALRGESKCPRCRKEWSGDVYVGERAAIGNSRAAAAAATGRASGTPGATTRTRRSQQVVADEDEEEEEEEEDEDESE